MKLIAQTVNIYPGDGKDPYARTGQLSFYHLKKAGATGVLIGHSELTETPQQINQKLKTAATMEMPDNVVLLGERWEDLQKPWEELNEQAQKGVVDLVTMKLRNIMQDVTFETTSKIVLAYEPAWSVKGSGKDDVPLPSPVQIDVVAKALRNTLTGLFGENADNIRILYGGSMSTDRAPEIAKLTSINGFIIGSAGTKTVNAKEIATVLQAQTSKQQKPVLALNWKAYELQEPYTAFLEILKQFENDVDMYLVPSATDLASVKQLM